ncbi:hypothetical protein T12_4748 [Trichinella patagoniensis]|uniref:Uncharacterized protein n=1 Tax=Trichinella patagoniensis TaxID=990121 RepID=A0A0V1AFQ1_9BILA|nr:hypothetical protein T12_4748 [Trichinella patagoniensis]
MLCMLLYLYGEWKLTGFFSIVVHQMLKTNEFFFDYCSVHVSTVISHVSQQFRFTHRHSNNEFYALSMGCVSAVELFL